jgi:hypothetical protein
MPPCSLGHETHDLFVWLRLRVGLQCGTLLLPAVAGWQPSAGSGHTAMVLEC